MENRSEFRSTDFLLYTTRTCNGTNPGHATTVETYHQDTIINSRIAVTFRWTLYKVNGRIYLALYFP